MQQKKPIISNWVTPDNDFAAIDILRDLETSRSELANKNAHAHLHMLIISILKTILATRPLYLWSMDWISSSDNDEPFTIVINKGKKIVEEKTSSDCF
jgi:hypothetical protein